MQMNRRDFLKVVTATLATVAVPSLIPADAKFVPGDQITTTKAIGNIIRTIYWDFRRSAHFVCYQGRINNTEYYVGDFTDEVDQVTLTRLDNNAMKAFKRRADVTNGKLTIAA